MCGLHRAFPRTASQRQSPSLATTGNGSFARPTSSSTTTLWLTKKRHTQIVNGTAGVGKSSFLLYALARCRCAGKSVLLHYHPTDKETATATFFPANDTPLIMSTCDSGYFATFRKWYKQIGSEESLFLVDGVVSFTKDDFQGVTYVAARSPSCSIGFMEKIRIDAIAGLNFGHTRSYSPTRQLLVFQTQPRSSMTIGVIWEVSPSMPFLPTLRRRQS